MPCNTNVQFVSDITALIKDAVSLYILWYETSCRDQCVVPIKAALVYTSFTMNQFLSHDWRQWFKSFHSHTCKYWKWTVLLFNIYIFIVLITSVVQKNRLSQWFLVHKRCWLLLMHYTISPHCMIVHKCQFDLLWRVAGQNSYNLRQLLDTLSVKPRLNNW